MQREKSQKKKKEAAATSGSAPAAGDDFLKVDLSLEKAAEVKVIILLN